MRRRRPLSHATSLVAETCLSDSQIAGFTPKAEPGTSEYKSSVAEAVMSAIDKMPASYRRLVHEFGYVDVYRAWRRGWTTERIAKSARSGVFVL